MTRRHFVALGLAAAISGPLLLMDKRPEKIKMKIDWKTVEGTLDELVNIITTSGKKGVVMVCCLPAAENLDGRTFYLSDHTFRVLGAVAFCDEVERIRSFIEQGKNHGLTFTLFNPTEIPLTSVIGVAA